MLHHRRSFHRKRPRRLMNPQMPAPTPAPVRATDGAVPMLALTLIYHEDFEPEVTGLIQQKMLVARYTKVRDVIGARADVMQGTDFDSSGKNNMLIIVATQEVVHELSLALRTLRQVKGHGLRGYITPVEGLI